MITMLISAAFVTSILSNSLNPVKICMLIIILSISTFYMIFNMRGRAWFPMILLIIFVGGIIMMFIILSSTIPNINIKKGRLTLTILTIFFFIQISTTKRGATEVLNRSKWVFQSNHNISFMVLLILIFFFSFITIISKEKFPLRSVTCHYKRIL